jgi:hypothetical protein
MLHLGTELNGTELQASIKGVRFPRNIVISCDGYYDISWPPLEASLHD